MVCQCSREFACIVATVYGSLQCCLLWVASVVCVHCVRVCVRCVFLTRLLLCSQVVSAHADTLCLRLVAFVASGAESPPAPCGSCDSCTRAEYLQLQQAPEDVCFAFFQLTLYYLTVIPTVTFRGLYAAAMQGVEPEGESYRCCRCCVCVLLTWGKAYG